MVAILCLLLAGCVAYSTYNNLKPISPKPHSVRIYAPVSVDSLHPMFKWSTQSADQQVDLAIWEAIYNGTGLRNNISTYVKGPIVYYREGVIGGEHQIETNLAPETIYFWSIKPTGTMNWSTANHVAVISAPGVDAMEVARALFFSIKTPKD
jgi:hypothetical protein